MDLKMEIRNIKQATEMTRHEKESQHLENFSFLR